LTVDYEVVDNVIRINALNWAIEPSIEDSEAAMGIAIDTLLEVKSAERLVFAESREIEYDYEQVKLLLEIANAFNKILNEDKLISIKNLGPPQCEKFFPKRLADLQFLILEVLRKDPIGAYYKLQRMITQEKILADKAIESSKVCHTAYIDGALSKIEKILSSTRLIQIAKPYLSNFKPGDRTLYREIFHPLIKPNFMLTRYMMIPPKDGQRVERYTIGNGILVEIFKVPGAVRNIYHVTPPEFRLSEAKYTILDNARRYLAAHKPTETEFTEPEKTREIFFNIGRDLVKELAANMGIELTVKEMEELATILSRYTAGFGVLEILLSDDKIQDIYINSPVGLSPIYISHADFEDCETNLIPTREDAEAWATRFRLISGRPLDEANPVLDTELEVSGGRARVAAITKTLSPEALAFALRRHRDKPWTFPLFIENKYLDPLYAGVMSFIIDGGRSILVAGGRGSGKTSLLGSMMLELMKKFRIITVEDSVTGDCQIVYSKNGKLVKSTVKDLVDSQFNKHGFEIVNDREISLNHDAVKVFSFDSENKLTLSEVSQFIRHKVKKPIYEVETRTGKTIKVTGDHSLFTLGNNGELKTIKTNKLKVGDYIATPRLLKSENKPLTHVNLLEHLEKLPETFVTGLSEVIKLYEKEIKSIAVTSGYPKAKGRTYPSVFQNWKRKGILPSKIVTELFKKGIKFDSITSGIRLKSGSSLPIILELDNEFLTFIGLWLAEGCYDERSVIISSPEEECENIVYSIAEKFGLPVKRHSDGFSVILNSHILKEVMKKVLELTGDAYTKRIPAWCYSLSNKQISSLLKGLFSGDGYLTPHEIGISLTSKELTKDVQTLLLLFGIVGRVNRINKRDKTFSLSISSIKFIRNFYQTIRFLQNKRNKSLSILCGKLSTHGTTDIIPLPTELRTNVVHSMNYHMQHDYVIRDYNFGREEFNEFLSGEEGNLEFGDLKFLTTSDIFWDEIRGIRLLENTEQYVYDFSVPENENFVCENIVAHNTLELPGVALRELGFNIERMKSRSVITRVEAELPADEALRTALRLGDSVLIVGEVRSIEAKALYEAMRIGALANVVAGTIHGESAYGVFDRVVNDLGVPPTSFKATDIITLANSMHTPDGLHKFRRVVELTEIRKHWKTDPVEEGGFVTLMEYSAKEDRLKPTDTLIDGESFVINEIARRVREWRGNWDAVWDNILLRTKVKQAIVEYAKKLKRNDILEAEWTIMSNEMFHLFSDQVMQEVGGLDSKIIYDRWISWFENSLKKG